jgi:hypothetical protein
LNFERTSSADGERNTYATMKDTVRAVGSSAIVRRRVYFTMIEHPFNGWIRVGKAYGTRKAAQGWLPFVRKAWRGLRGKVSSCSLTWRDGKLDDASVKRLDAFNMDAPDDSANGDYPERLSR